MKKFLVCTITLVVTGLVITSGAVSIMHRKKNTIFEKQIGIKKKLTSMDMSVSVINGPKQAIKKQMTTLSRGTDVLVHHDIDENDCQNPALVTDAGLNNILVFTEYYEGVGQTGMWGRWSMDIGETWSDEIVGFEAIPEDNPDDISIPKLDYYQDSMAYGTWTAGPLNDATIYYLELPCIVDPDSGWTYYYVDWSDVGSFTNFDSADVACYPYDAVYSPSAEFWGILVGTGDAPASDYNPPENNTVWLQYNVPGGGAGIWWFYNIDEDCEKMACDIDVSIHQPYFVCEYYMEEDPSDNGFLFFKTPKLRYDSYPNDNWVQDQPGFTGFSFEDVLTPDIVAADGSVYIVAQTSGGDIVCFYSDDAGDSFQQSIVSQDAATESYPQVTLHGPDVICTYTRSGNLYVKVSDDGGVNWGDEVQINDENETVVEQYGCTGIDGPFASWTDNRAAPPTEIYIDSTNTIGNPPSAPLIWGPPRGKPVLRGLLGIKPLPRPLPKPGTYNFTFKATDPDGDQVRYLIDWGDGNTEETGFYPSGQNVTVPHTWTTAGIYTIIAKAQDSTGLIGPEITKIFI